MLKVKGNNIKLTRGDTAYLTVPITDTVSAEEYLFQKVIQGSNVFKILPTDTSDLRYGTYIYDVQLDMANGDRFTIIEPSNFEITSEVTR